MLRLLSITLGTLILLSGLGFAEDRPVIPPGVRYKFLDDQEEATVRASLVAKFQQGETGVAELFQGPCALAPGFWKTIADSDCVKQPIPSTFSIPNGATGVTEKLTGATVKDPEDLHRLAQRVATDVGKTPVIRRLTTAEIGQTWAIVPFDLEEPLYVLENGNRHFMVILLKDSTSGTYTAMWVDLLTGYQPGTATKAVNAEQKDQNP